MHPRSANSTKLNLIIAYSEYVLNLVKLEKNVIFKAVCYTELGLNWVNNGILCIHKNIPTEAAQIVDHLEKIDSKNHSSFIMFSCTYL